MVLPVDTVMYQMQEVAAVIADSRYAAADGAAAVEVDYEPLPVVVDPFKALEPDAPLLRPDREIKSNRIFHWEAGDAAATDKAFADADVVVEQDMYIPRIHVASIETCGCVAQVDPVSGKLTVWMTTQAPHAIRTVFSLVSGIPETQDPHHLPRHRRRVRRQGACLSGVRHRRRGGVDHRQAGEVDRGPLGESAGRLVRSRLPHEGASRRQPGRQDHGARRDAPSPTMARSTRRRTRASSRPGCSASATGSYDLETAHVEVDGVYTNKPPGGVAYRCSFRVTEAVHMIERMVDILADELKVDAAELRFQNFIQPEQFPYKSPTGWEYDSGNYPAALKLALEKIGYQDLLREQQEKRARGELMGIGISTFTEIVGAGPSNTFDILGIKMFDSAEIRVHPTGSAIVRIGVQTQGQGHETTFAQIVADELGLPVDNIIVEHGDTDTAPYGLGTYASRSTPTAGAATAMASRKIREKARELAAHLLEVSADDLEWVDHKFQVKGSPGSSKTMQEIAFAAYTNHPQGMEAGLEAVSYYDPPNLTFPFGAYICVVDIDRGTGMVKIRRFLAIDDCGTVINPMIVEGQIHGGLAMGMAPALLEEISYDEYGNVRGGTFMDYLLPTSMETPAWETDRTVTPSPHHPFGAKGVGESATVGAPPAIVERRRRRAVAPRRAPHRHPDHAVEGVRHPGGARRGGIAQTTRGVRRSISAAGGWFEQRDFAAQMIGAQEDMVAGCNGLARGSTGTGTGRAAIRPGDSRAPRGARVRSTGRKSTHPPGWIDAGLGRRELRAASRHE